MGTPEIDYGRDVDVGKYMSSRDRAEILLRETLAALEEGSITTETMLSNLIHEMENIRTASELILGQELTP